MKQLLAFALSLATIPVLADTESGLHIGVGAGQAKADAASLGLSASDTAIKGFLGYRFNRSLAIEAAYIEGGEFSSSYADQTVRGATVAALGGFPLGKNAALYAKVGALRWNADTTAVINQYPGYRILSYTTSGTDLVWGAGLQANAGRVGFRAEYERSEVDGVTYSLVSGSLLFMF